VPTRIVYSFLILATTLAAADRKTDPAKLTPLDRYIQDSLHGVGVDSQPSSGSLWSSRSRLTDLGSDLRAAQVNDLITIQVLERASAVAQGVTKSKRQSSVNSSIAAVGGVKNPAGPLANLANLGTASQLDGQGATSRNTELSTTLSARITHVLPNGYLVVEGNKEVVVNSERQLVTVRGVVRPADIAPTNVIGSDQIAQMELKINGKGVVGDSIRRPFFLYRLLLGLLPF
jgi:flagellar L-ring protein FlgH